MESMLQWCRFVHTTALAMTGSISAQAAAMLGLTRPVSKHFAANAAAWSLLTWSNYKEQRQAFEAMAAEAEALVKKQGVCTIRKELDSVTITSAVQQGSAEQPDVLLLYIHGGGMVWGTPVNAAPVMAQMIAGLQAEHGLRCQVISLDYDLAPEHPFPHSLSQVVAKIHALLEQWHTEPAAANAGGKRCPPALVLMGDTAGGNLVLAALLALHQHCPVPALSHSLPPIAGAFVLSPWLDLTPAAQTYLPAYPAGKAPWWQLLADLVYGTNFSAAQLQHVHPCTKHDQPAATCECVAQHRVRVETDMVSQQFTTSCADLYTGPTLARAASRPGMAATAAGKADRAPAGSSPVFDTLLQQVDGCADLGALRALPIVSPGHADPALVSAALRSLLHSPALVLAGELELMVPDSRRMVDRVNQAAGGGKLQAAAADGAGVTAEVRLAGAGATKEVSVPSAMTASAAQPVGTGGLQLEEWKNDVHVAAFLPGREALVPRMYHYVADATKAWQRAYQEA